MCVRILFWGCLQPQGSETAALGLAHGAFTFVPVRAGGEAPGAGCPRGQLSPGLSE